MSSKEETLKHREQVGLFIKWIVVDLMERAKVHDESKIQEPEISIFDEYTPKLKNTTYGSDKYKGYLKEMGKALEHHYQENRHHPEHFTKYVCNGCFKKYKEMPNTCDLCGYSQFQKESDISQMNLVDLVEMFCDWWAASLRHNDGDIRRSIDLNQGRFGYSDDLKEIMKNTVSFFNC